MLASYALPTSVSTFPFSLVFYFWLHQDRAAEGPSSHERTCSMQRILQHSLSGQQHYQGQQLLANGSFAALCGIGQQLPVDLRQPPRNQFPELSQPGWSASVLVILGVIHQKIHGVDFFFLNKMRRETPFLCTKKDKNIA